MILRIAIVLIILIAMSVVLIGIHHCLYGRVKGEVFRTSGDASDRSGTIGNTSDRSNTIGDENVFRNFLGR